MDLRARLIRFATARPRAFVVTAPGATRTRLLVEAELRRRGGRSLASPTAATTLIVCGAPGAGPASAVDVIWDDMPGPRSLVRLAGRASAGEVAAALDRAARELTDVAAQWADAAARREGGPWAPEDGGAEEHGDHVSGHEHGHAAPSESGDHGGHGEHGGHEGHGGHEQHMGVPVGLPMAERADDRDGLKLDVLHVPLGPALNDWPAGLVLRLTLQGDVVQAAEADTVDGSGHGTSFWDEPWLRAAAGERVSEGEAERRRAASHLDSVGRLLAVAGWEHAAERARHLRDDVLAGAPADESAARFAGLARRTGRSRTLRWMLGGVGVIDQAMVDRHGLTGPAADRLGDVFARLRGWLDEIGTALGRIDATAPLGGTGGPRGPVERRPSAALLGLLPELLEGAELAAARLTVAGLDPDVEQLAAAAGVAGA